MKIEMRELVRKIALSTLELDDEALGYLLFKLCAAYSEETNRVRARLKARIEEAKRKGWKPHKTASGFPVYGPPITEANPPLTELRKAIEQIV